MFGKSKLSELEERIEKLEDKFEYPAISGSPWMKLETKLYLLGIELGYSWRDRSEGWKPTMEKNEKDTPKK